MTLSAICNPEALQLAYIGPGAGFAFLGSFFILLAAVFLVILALLSWPFRAALALFRRRGRARRRTGIRRVVIVGLDGLDPARCRALIAAGRLPALARLAEEGMFRDLATTCPPISPVAWSSFMTGANPGKHGIFDFLGRDPRTYLPELSSARVETVRGRPVFRGLRRSRPFWHVLGEHGVFSAILRVPLTFPPEPFEGLLLSGMCVPDLQGTQGTFTCFTDDPALAAGRSEGGQVIPLHFVDGCANGCLPGPPKPKQPGENIGAPLTIRIRPDGRRVRLDISRQRLTLQPGRYSGWIRVRFRLGPWRAVNGICRFYLHSIRPFRLYVTPVNIDPEKPALPISHPPLYAIYLAKLHGPFATLGLAEDTWARNAGVIDDRTFLEQVWSIHAEREAMFLDALRRTRRGLCVCVFDASDRIQHMFMRPDGAKLEGLDQPPEAVIEEMYARLDALVGAVRGELGPDDVLIVMSDHGFTRFRRGVNLNAWLRTQGWLASRPGREAAAYLQGIDWTRTRAYTFGLSGIYLNRRGREAQGILNAAEAERAKQEIADRLRALVDPATGQRAVREVYDARQTYRGPYVEEGPDLIVGFEAGYRAAWEAAVGRADGDVFSDNTQPWSGDHCVDRALVPGVFFCNRALNAPAPLRIVDIAPTVLNLLGVPAPAYMDGRSAALREPVA